MRASWPGRVVRRPVSHPDAPRNDDRRARLSSTSTSQSERRSRLPAWNDGTDTYADDTGLPWVMPSPNMPTLDAAVVYPGTVLFEGTNLSEGRGTTRPFELVGAPWIDADRFAEAMNALDLPGVYFRPAVFEPTFQKHAQRACGGCQIHVTDRLTFRPVITGVALIQRFAASIDRSLPGANRRMNTSRKAADRYPCGLRPSQDPD